MSTTNFEYLYLFALFSPAELATMLVLVGVVAWLGDQEEPLTMRGAFALMLTVGIPMLLVSAILSAFGAPKWLTLVAYFVVWWAVLTIQARIAPRIATVAVACLMGVNMLGHAIQARVLRPAMKQVSNPGVNDSLKTLDEAARRKKPLPPVE